MQPVEATCGAQTVAHITEECNELLAIGDNSQKLPVFGMLQLLIEIRYLLAKGLLTVLSPDRLPDQLSA